MVYRVRRSFVDPLDGRPYHRNANYSGADPDHIRALIAIGVLDDAAGHAPPKLDDRLVSVGGGWYEIPGGERVQGKEAALAALAALDSDADVNGGASGAADGTNDGAVNAENDKGNEITAAGTDKRANLGDDKKAGATGEGDAHGDAG